MLSSAPSTTLAYSGMLTSLVWLFPVAAAGCRAVVRDPHPLSCNILGLLQILPNLL